MEMIKKSCSYFLSGPKNTDRIRIFCFPYAGGGAFIYKDWQKSFMDNIGVYPIQLPGREKRISEVPIDDMNILIEEIAEEILQYLDRPFIFFGHSLGGKIAYELCRYLRKEYNINPCHLIVSGSTAPHIPASNPIYNLDDDMFIKELHRFSGTPEEILNNKDLMKFFLPMLRSDFTLDEKYSYHEDEPLECNITAFAGTHDEEAVKEDVEAWGIHTKKDFKIEMFYGGHFFIKSQKEDVLTEIKKIADKYLF